MSAIDKTISSTKAKIGRVESDISVYKIKILQWYNIR